MSQPAIRSHNAKTTQRMRLGRSGDDGDVSGMRGLYRRPRAGSSVAAWLVLALGVSLGGRAVAQEAHRIDLTRGPVLSSSRITGLAGAFTGIGVGIDGAYRNPASLANRPDHSTSWFDYDIALDWIITPGDQVDFDADGRSGGADTSLSAINAGLSLLFDTFAIGVYATVVDYATNKFPPGSRVGSADVSIGAAYAFLDGGLILGGNLNVRALDIDNASVATDTAPESSATASFTATTGTMGVLVRPRDEPWRAGASLRLGSTTEASSVEGMFADGRAIRDIIAPWRLSLGFSYFFPADPARRYNAPLRSGSDLPSDERDDDLRYWLISADLVFIGTSSGAVNLEGYFAGAPRAVGREVVASIHLGVEGEPLSNLLRVRAGTYLEPDRVKGTTFGRMHLTGGIEVRLFRLWIWQLKATAAFDVSSQFQNILVGVGFWN